MKRRKWDGMEVWARKDRKIKLVYGECLGRKRVVFRKGSLSECARGRRERERKFLVKGAMNAMYEMSIFFFFLFPWFNPLSYYDCSFWHVSLSPSSTFSSSARNPFHQTCSSHGNERSSLLHSLLTSSESRPHLSWPEDTSWGRELFGGKRNSKRKRE